MVRWTVDLCSYVTLDDPGRYGVEVEVVFAPSGLAVRSERVWFHVIANHVRAFDALLDAVATPVLHTAAVHEDADDVRLLVHLRSVHSPLAAWRGGVRAVPSGTRPRVAEADYASRASFAPDFARWFGWEEGGTLVLWRFHEPAGPDDDGWGPTCGRPLPAGGRWFGRPIEHADGGVSAWLGRPADGGGWRLVRARWDASGAGLGEDAGVVLGGEPMPAVVQGDAAGSTWLACGQSGGLPLTLVRVAMDGSVTQSQGLDAGMLPAGWRSLETRAPSDQASPELDDALDPAATPVLLGVRLGLKPHRDAFLGVLAAVVVPRRDGTSTALLVGRAGFERLGTAEAWTWRRLAVEPGTFAPGESIVAVDLVALGDDRLAVLASTSLGRVLRDAGDRLLPIAHEDPAAVRDCALAVIDRRPRAVLPTAAEGIVVV